MTPESITPRKRAPRAAKAPRQKTKIPPHWITRPSGLEPGNGVALSLLEAFSREPWPPPAAEGEQAALAGELAALADLVTKAYADGEVKFEQALRLLWLLGSRDWRGNSGYSVATRTALMGVGADIMFRSPRAASLGRRAPKRPTAVRNLAVALMTAIREGNSEPVRAGQWQLVDVAEHVSALLRLAGISRQPSTLVSWWRDHGREAGVNRPGRPRKRGG